VAAQEVVGEQLQLDVIGASTPSYRSRRIIAVAAFFVLALALVVSRLPFLGNTLLGEEGMFAVLVLDPKTPSSEVANGLPQQLIAQIDGRRVYGIFEHQIVPYLIMERGVGILGRAAHTFERDFTYRNIVARGCYFVLFCIGVLGLLWLAAASIVETRLDGPRFVVAVLVVYFLSTPLLLGASIQPQVDGSVGVMLTGLAALTITAGLGRGQRSAALLAAGVLIGLGRIEWVLVFIPASLAVLVGQVALANQAPRHLPLIFVVGLVIGSAISYLASPDDYIAGIDLLKRFSTDASSSFEAARQQWFLLTPVFAAAASAVIFVMLQLRRLLREATGTLVLTLGSVGMIAGFAVSNWVGDGFPRYYAPAIVTLSYAIVDLATRTNWSNTNRVAAVSLMLVGGWFNLTYALNGLSNDSSITSLPGTRLALARAQMEESAKWAEADRAIPFEYSSFIIYYPNLSFVSRDLGLDIAKELLTETNPADVGRLRVP
jgi:hypothetical protein